MRQIEVIIHPRRMFRKPNQTRVGLLRPGAGQVDTRCGAFQIQQRGWSRRADADFATRVDPHPFGTLSPERELIPVMVIDDAPRVGISHIAERNRLLIISTRREEGHSGMCRVFYYQIISTTSCRHAPSRCGMNVQRSVAYGSHSDGRVSINSEVIPHVDKTSRVYRETRTTGCIKPQRVSGRIPVDPVVTPQQSIAISQMYLTALKFDITYDMQYLGGGRRANTNVTRVA